MYQWKSFPQPTIIFLFLTLEIPQLKVERWPEFTKTKQQKTQTLNKLSNTIWAGPSEKTLETWKPKWFNFLKITNPTVITTNENDLGKISDTQYKRTIMS